VDATLAERRFAASGFANDNRAKILLAIDVAAAGADALR
jgi:hypothetical protein